MSIAPLRDRLAAAPPQQRTPLLAHWQRGGRSLDLAAWDEPEVLADIAELLLEAPRVPSARAVVWACRSRVLQVVHGSTDATDLCLAGWAVRALLACDEAHEAWPVLAHLERADPPAVADLTATHGYRTWAARTVLQCDWEDTYDGPAARIPPAPGPPVHRHMLDEVTEVPLGTRTVRTLRALGGRDVKVGRADLEAIAVRLGCTPGTLGGALFRSPHADPTAALSRLVLEARVGVLTLTTRTLLEGVIATLEPGAGGTLAVDLDDVHRVRSLAQALRSTRNDGTIVLAEDWVAAARRALAPLGIDLSVSLDSLLPGGVRIAVRNRRRTLEIDLSEDGVLLVQDPPVVHVRGHRGPLAGLWAALGLGRAAA